ncbi:N(4)-acetylcytidine aminohydrolase [Iodobacter sp. LRB]|uniref:N(4)-acetylcytidine aminohydrolase n=1 Tax=unclassified Iodobacter TaxID=235634 RepID=UPI000C102BE3|nr:N(4)-acetylcytidine aminohydrolase [Iodobacter sp. BJB302]PHV00832.1 ASCH domain-containing protein [Iodobacter sp. BJB302]
MQKITFFKRFVDDILAERKTITIRDTSEANVQAGDILEVSTLEEGLWFCRVRVLSVTQTDWADLTPLHAAQENMGLSELKQLIKEIYPGQDHFYVIHFELVK